MPLFVKHSPMIHSAGFTWLDVEIADSLAMKDIEESEYRLWRYIRPNIQRSSKAIGEYSE